MTIISLGLIHAQAAVPPAAPLCSVVMVLCPSAAGRPKSVVPRPAGRRGVFRVLDANASWRCRSPRLRATRVFRQPHSQLSVSLYLRDTKKSHACFLVFDPLFHWVLHFRRGVPAWRVLCAADDQEEVEDLGVNVALSMLKFYKREISPLLPSSCRYVPTCSEYSMQAYKRYGVVKGTILTAWRLCRCNPFGGYGYDPPRWFGEDDVPLQ